MKARTVLISGLGIAGPTLAYWLREAGFEPTLIEQSPAPRRGGYVIDFWGLGYDIAERMGLVDEIDRVGYHMREMRVVDDAGNRVAGFGTRVFGELTGGRFITLGRSDLSRLLFGTIKTTVPVIFGDEITALDENSDAVRVQFEHGAERQFDLVIGADGLHSGVRRLAFGPDDQFETQLGYGVAAFEVRGYRPRDEDIYLIHSQPGRTVARFTLHDDRVLFLLVFAVNGTLPADLTLTEQKALLRREFGNGKWETSAILDDLDRTDDLYFDRVSQIKMASWSRGRVALVGDAAFCVSLLAGQGSALAMTAAYVLAGELRRRDGDYREAFVAYEKLLRAYIATKQRGAARFGSAFAPKTRWGLFFRKLVIEACAIPGVARWSFGRDIVDLLRLPDYHWPRRQD
jgi:2-polyprenyl-6-methoxyphenol hydroxylase-like FAD-dependent oxidoreductase